MNAISSVPAATVIDPSVLASLESAYSSNSNAYPTAADPTQSTAPTATTPELSMEVLTPPTPVPDLASAAEVERLNNMLRSTIEAAELFAGNLPPDEQAEMKAALESLRAAQTQFNATPTVKKRRTTKITPTNMPAPDVNDTLTTTQQTLAEPANMSPAALMVSEPTPPVAEATEPTTPSIDDTSRIVNVAALSESTQALMLPILAAAMASVAGDPTFNFDGLDPQAREFAIIAHILPTLPEDLLQQLGTNPANVQKQLQYARAEEVLSPQNVQLATDAITQLNPEHPKYNDVRQLFALSAAELSIQMVELHLANQLQKPMEIEPPVHAAIDTAAQLPETPELQIQGADLQRHGITKDAAPILQKNQSVMSS
jgi:hypothetical protein